MYSVVIQSKNSMECFQRYQLIFSAAISNEAMGVCKWNSAGTTLDTSLPELKELIDDKEEWRAIIVQYCDDDGTTSFNAKPHNPYDFYINETAHPAGEENPVPLVRLVQMLGGIPPLEVEFQAKVIKEDYRAPRTIYVPVENQAREEAYHQLVAQYKFDGKPPVGILVITIRDRNQIHEFHTNQSWGIHKESESSEFWKRNYFPSICRFMVYDVDYRGNTQRDADDFSFWYGVMLMATNDWDSSVLQAYRLYLLQVTLDRPAMEQSFQSLADRLRDAKVTIEKDIRRDIEQKVCVEEALPDYRLDISVPIKLPKSKDCLAGKEKFPLLSEGATTDVALWAEQRHKVEEQLVSSIRSAERALDQTADRMRDNCTFTKEEVYSLNKYQEEDMLRETQKLYHDVVTLQNTLLSEDTPAQAQTQEASEQVRTYLLGRVTMLQAVYGYVLTVLLLSLALVPTALLFPLEGGGTTIMLLVVLAIMVGLPLLCGIGMLCYHHSQLKELMSAYNQHLKNAFNQLVERADDYSTYMSSIVSHARGSSYLNLSQRKKQYVNSEHYGKYKHIQEINMLLNKLNIWSNAHHLKVDFSGPRENVAIDIDVTINPAENKAYAFDGGEIYPVMINRSGAYMNAPHPFANKISITREELYDDQ